MDVGARHSVSIIVVAWLLLYCIRWTMDGVRGIEYSRNKLSRRNEISPINLTAKLIWSRVFFSIGPIYRAAQFAMEGGKVSVSLVCNYD